MLIFVVNPVAGGGLAKTCMERLQTTLRSRKVPYQVIFSNGTGHATELAREAARTPGCDAVISVGGDGTAYEVASGMLDSGKPMGIIPAGTGNDFIKTLQYPKDPEQALQVVLKGEARPVDLVRLNDRCFLNIMGTGFDVTVLQQAERYRGKLHGMLPYFLGLLRAIVLFRPVKLKLELDGQECEREVLICAVANGRYFGGGIPICPEAEPDDGLLNVVMVKAVPRWRIPFYLPGLLMSKVLGFSITEHVKCRNVRISAENMDVQCDGEISRIEKADIRVCAGKLMLYR